MNNLLKHFLIIIIASFLILFAMPYCKIALQALLDIHSWAINILSHVFAHGKTAIYIRDLIVIIAIPSIISGLIAFIYWIFKRKQFPYLFHICWAIWGILMVSLILQLH